jgi:hypothetical protein
MGFEGAVTAEPDGLWIPLCWNRIPRSAFHGRCRRQMAVNAFLEERSRTWSAKTLDGWVGSFGTYAILTLNGLWTTTRCWLILAPVRSSSKRLTRLG